MKKPKPDTPTVTAWKQPEELVDEARFTPWAERGWWSWNGQSPEHAVCEFVKQLVLLTKPQFVVETGVGQGYMTRAIVEGLIYPDQRLVSYESSDRWRAAMWDEIFWRQHYPNAVLAEHPMPGVPEFSKADLCVLDSDWVERFAEIQCWHDHARPGTLALIHDTSGQPETIHASLRDKIAELGMNGFFLQNPRGCFMAIQTERSSSGNGKESPGEEASG